METGHIAPQFNLKLNLQFSDQDTSNIEVTHLLMVASSVTLALYSKIYCHYHQLSYQLTEFSMT